MLPTGQTYISSRPLNRKDYILEHMKIWMELHGKETCAKIITYDETRDTVFNAYTANNLNSGKRTEYIAFNTQEDFEQSEAWMKWYCEMFFNGDEDLLKTKRFPVYTGRGVMVFSNYISDRSDNKIFSILSEQWKLIIPMATGRVGLFTDFAADPAHFMNGEKENNGFFWLFEKESDAALFRLTCEDVSISV